MRHWPVSATTLLKWCVTVSVQPVPSARVYLALSIQEVLLLSFSLSWMNFMVSARVGLLAADAAAGAAGTKAAGGCSAGAAPPFAKIALSSASVAPACLSAASASAEVSNLPGVAEITCSINLSCTPFRSSFKTSALAGASLSDLGGGGTDCCAERVKANPHKRHAASKFFMFMILSSFCGDGGSRDCSVLRR